MRAVERKSLDICLLTASAAATCSRAL